MNTDAVIFDFDDTLVHTNILYDQAREILFAVLRERGCGGQEQWAAYLNDADIANISRFGFLADRCFPLAMRETFLHFTALSGQEEDGEEAERMEQAGWRVLDVPPQPLAGAEETLAALRGRARLYLFSQGEEESQRRRIRASNLDSWFDGVRVVRRKDVPAYRELLREENIEPSCSWMIGNSLRSDVNPALAVGLRAVRILSSAWSYDLVEAAGDYISIYDLRELAELI